MAEGATAPTQEPATSLKDSPVESSAVVSVARHRFLAVHELSPDSTAADVRVQLERVAEASHALGLSPAETFFSLENHKAYTIYDVGDARTIQRAFESVGVPTVEVVGGEQVFTELLDEPRRNR